MDNQNQEFLRQTEKIGKIGSWKIDISDSRLTWTQGIFDILEMEKYDELSVARNINDYLPEYREQVMTAIKNCIDYDIPIKLEAEVYTSSRKRKWVEAIGKNNGTSIIGTLQDITERKVNEERIKQSTEGFKAIFYQSPLPSIMVSMDLEIIRVNHAMLEITGYTEDEFLELHPSDLTHPEELDKAIEAYTDLKKGKTKEYTVRRRLVKKDGSNVYVKLNNSIIRDPQGNPRYYLPIIEDITPVIEVEKLSKRFELIFHNIPVGMIMTDSTGNILEINQEQLKVLGSPSKEATQQINMITFPPMREAGIAQEYEKCLKEGVPVSVELPYTTKWGKETYFRSKINPLFDEQSQVIGCISVVEDILDRVRAQNELQKSEQRFLQLFTTIKEAVDIVDRELKYTKRTPISFKRALTEVAEDAKLTQINDALLHTQGNVKRAAIYLGISRSALHRLIVKYKIPKNKFK